LYKESISMGTKRYIIIQPKKQSAFTIVEILIVVVVITILVSITAIAYDGLTTRANQNAMQANLKQIAATLKIYKADNGSYPSTLAALNANQTLYNDKTAVWAYTLTSDTYCMSLGSTSTSLRYHYGSAVGKVEDGLCSNHTVAMLTNDGGGSGGSGGGTTTPAPTVNFPTRSGFTNVSDATYAGDNTAVSIGSVPNGSWMVVVFAYTNQDVTTPPSGWTIVMPSTRAGTMQMMGFAKIKEATDANLQLFDAALTNGEATVNGLFMWGSGSAPVSSWVTGAYGSRGAYGSSTTVVTPTVTTTVAKSLILSIAMERTTAAEANYTSLTGVNPWAWVPQNGTYKIQTIAVGYEEKATAGVSQAMTVTYPNSQTANGSGIQLVIPPAS
jgi:Tfp pilus assembly protein PilE